MGLKDKLLKRREQLEKVIERKADSLSGEDYSSEKSKDIRFTPTVEVGTYYIRFVPPLDEDMDPFKEIHFHYAPDEIKDKIKSDHSLNTPFGIMCPKKNFGEECPVCDWAWENFNRVRKDKSDWDWDDLKEDEEYQFYRSFLPNARYYSLVLDRAREERAVEEEDPTQLYVQWYAYSNTVYKDLIETIRDPMFGDFTLPFPVYDDEDFTGRDFKLTKTKEPKAWYAKTSLKIVPSTSWLLKKDKGESLEEAVERMEELIETAPPITDLYEIQPRSEVTSESAGKWLEEIMAIRLGDKAPEELSSEIEISPSSSADQKLAEFEEAVAE